MILLIILLTCSFVISLLLCNHDKAEQQRQHQGWQPAPCHQRSLMIQGWQRAPTMGNQVSGPTMLLITDLSTQHDNDEEQQRTTRTTDNNEQEMDHNEEEWRGWTTRKTNGEDGWR